MIRETPKLTEMDNVNGLMDPSSHDVPTGQKLSVVSVLRCWWHIAIPVGILLAGGFAAAAFFMVDPQYEARAILRVQKEEPFLIYPDGSSQKDNFVSGQKAILTSPIVLEQLLTKTDFLKLPEIREMVDPVKELSRKIKVRSGEGSELMEVSFTGPNPKNAAKIVNWVVAEYFKEVQKNEITRFQDTIDMLEKEKDLRTAEVKRLRDQVRKLSIKITNRDPYSLNDEPSSDTSLVNDLQKRLTENKYRQTLLKKEIEAFEEKLKNEPPKPSDEKVEVRLLNEPRIVAADSLIRSAEREYDDYRANSQQGPNHPSVRSLAQKIKNRKKEYDDLLVEIRPQVQKQLEVEELESRKQVLKGMEKQLQTLEFGADYLNEEKAEEEKKLADNRQKQSGDTLDLEFKQSELQSAQSVLDQLSNRVRELRTEQFAPERVILAREASAPSSPVSEYPIKEMALGIIVGFGIPLGLAFLWELNVRRVSEVEQLASTFNPPIVAEVANLPRRVFGRNKVSRRMNRELRIYEESVDILRTNLMLALKEHDLQVLTVTSAVSGEGKTSLATQLAISIANASGKKTLLIDGDMRSPDIDQMFDIDNYPGFANVLSGVSSVEDAIVESSIENLDLLPAGSLSKGPASLLGGPRATELFESLREQYDFIVVDTPPVLSASETLMLANISDGTLFCAMRDVSRFSQVKSAWNRLNSSGIRMVGTVFNNVPTSRYAKTYGDYDYVLN